jgi:hypothetical protein
VQLLNDILQNTPAVANLAPGPAFGCEFWPSDPGPSLAGDLANPNDLGGTVALDTWIRSFDSRQYRVRVSTTTMGRFDFLPIDHGHYFGGPNWDPSNLDNDDQFIAPSIPIPVARGDVLRHVQRLRRFTAADAAHIVDQIPAEWNLSAEERISLTNYLARRASPASDALSRRYP